MIPEPPGAAATIGADIPLAPHGLPPSNKRPPLSAETIRELMKQHQPGDRVSASLENHAGRWRLRFRQRQPSRPEAPHVRRSFSLPDDPVLLDEIRVWLVRRREERKRRLQAERKRKRDILQKTRIIMQDVRLTRQRLRALCPGGRKHKQAMVRLFDAATALGLSGRLDDPLYLARAFYNTKPWRAKPPPSGRPPKTKKKRWSIVSDFDLNFDLGFDL